MDAELAQQLITLAEISHRLLARIELTDVLIAALIEHHPDPAAVRESWREVTSQATASLLMEAVESGRSSTYREQTHASVANWNALLDRICAQDDD